MFRSMIMTSQQKQTSMKPSPRACLACRNRHLRCDGGTPICSRCFDAKIECIYVQSRRGMRKNAHKDPSSTSPSVHIPTSPLGKSGGFTNSINDSMQQHEFGEHISDTLTEELEREHDPDPFHDSVRYQHLTNIYYNTIHHAHPFLLPRQAFAQNMLSLPDHLLAAMFYIASHRTTDDPELFRRRVQAVYDPLVPDGLFKVQTLILLALTSYARFERDLGNKALLCAKAVSERIGLNTNHCAEFQSEDVILQESCRRTWWELYTISGLISVISGVNYRLPISDELTLPTDDEEYDNCAQISIMGTSATMQRRFFMEDSPRWSSFAFRIEAVRLLNSAQELLTQDPTVDKYQAVDASITSYIFSLPNDKEEGLQKNGQVDELMSCSLMIIHLARICLHLKRSDIGTVQGLHTVCGNQSLAGVKEIKQATHRAACLGSANEVAHLIATRTTLETLSPCFSCALAYSAVVQLAECRLGSEKQDLLKEQLNMILGALKLLGKTWPIASVIRGQLAQFSRQVFLPPELVNVPMQIGMLVESESQDLEPWMQDLLSENFSMPADDFTLINF